jgi:hypothetical protein
MRKRHIAFAALAVLALGLVACDDAPEQGRLTAAVTSINGGNPVNSVVGSGTDDNISVTFTARISNEINSLLEGGPHTDFYIESYSITWTRIDGGTGVYPTRTEFCHIYVAAYESATGTIRLDSTTEKSSGTVAAGSILRADIEFTGRELGTEHEIKCKASTSVLFQ